MPRLGKHRESILGRVPKHLHWRYNEQFARLPFEPVPTGPTRILGKQIPRWMERRWILYLLGLVPYVPWMIGMFIVFQWMGSHRSAFVSGPFMWMIVLVGSYFLYGLFLRICFPRASSSRWRAWRALNLIGIRTCERCGYDCRDIEFAVCPECGASLEQAAPYAPDEATP